MAQEYPDGTGLSMANCAEFLTNLGWWGSRPQYVNCDMTRGAGLGTNTRGDNLSSWNFNSDGDDLGWSVALSTKLDTTVDLVFDIFVVAIGGNSRFVMDWELKELSDGVDVDTQVNISTGRIDIANGGPAGTINKMAITVTAAQLAALTLPAVLVANMDRFSTTTGNFGVTVIAANFNEVA